MADARGTPDVAGLIARWATARNRVTTAEINDRALRTELARLGDELAEALARVEAARQQAEQKCAVAQRLAEKWRDRAREEDWTTEMFPWEES